MGNAFTKANAWRLKVSKICFYQKVSDISAIGSPQILPLYSNNSTHLCLIFVVLSGRVCTLARECAIGRLSRLCRKGQCRRQTRVYSGCRNSKLGTLTLTSVCLELLSPQPSIVLKLHQTYSTVNLSCRAFNLSQHGPLNPQDVSTVYRPPIRSLPLHQERPHCWHCIQYLRPTESDTPGSAM